MNKVILSEIENAKKLFPLVFRELKKYTTKLDYQYYSGKRHSWSEKLLSEKALLKKLFNITGKDVAIINSYIDFSDWESFFEDKTLYNLSLIISLPEPKIIEDISQEELYEIWEIVTQENYKKSFNRFSGDIEYSFSEHFNDYFEKLLEINLQHLLDCDDVDGA